MTDDDATGDGGTSRVPMGCFTLSQDHSPTTCFFLGTMGGGQKGPPPSTSFLKFGFEALGLELGVGVLGSWSL